MDDCNSQQPTNTDDAPARIPLKGGPGKIIGVQQSAADAQAERERLARDEEGGGSSSGPADKIPLKGGPSKIIGVMQSAADAQAEREKFAQSQAGADDDGGDDGDAPLPVPIKGGPNKISSLKLTPEEFQKQRAEFDKEQQEKVGDGGVNADDGLDAPLPVPIKGGPNKIPSLGLTPAEFQKQREQFDKEQREKFGDGGTNADDGLDAPLPVPIKGGPNKISSLKLTPEEAERQRERFDLEQKEKFAQGGDGRPEGGVRMDSGVVQSSRAAGAEDGLL